jgi:roadblock/LC7 domain-containing protein
MDGSNNTGPWHLDKTVNLSHLLTTIVIAGSLFAYAGGMDKRVAVLEAKMTTQAQVTERAQQDMRELVNDVKFEVRALRADVMKQMQKEDGNK